MKKLNIIETSENFWDRHATWEEAEKNWAVQASHAAELQPIKQLKILPAMPGIAEKNLKWKALKWLILKDHQRAILRGFLRHPFIYGWRYLVSLWKGVSYQRDGDFFLYGVDSTEEFIQLLQKPNTLFVVGFSYCHKPFECPSGRFSSDCSADAAHPVCQQCFIGKAIHALRRADAITLAIPTVHYIGAKILELRHKHPKKELIFLITACEMTLEMFGDWGHMAGVRGIGVRLDGRICNTMRAFELSENGVKPGLTVVLPKTQQRILSLFQILRNAP